MKDTLIYLEACEEGQEFLDTQSSLEEAWNNCKNPQWMLWALEKINYNNESALRLFACACVRETPLGDGRKVWDLLEDSRSREAVEVAERFARDEATQEELGAAAGSTVDDGAYAAYAAYANDAAWAEYASAAAGARNAAADAEYAWSAASAAADAASRAVAGSDAGSDAWAARASANEFQANLLRQMIGNPFVLNSISESV